MAKNNGNSVASEDIPLPTSHQLVTKMAPSGTVGVGPVVATTTTPSPVSVQAMAMAYNAQAAYYNYYAATAAYPTHQGYPCYYPYQPIHSQVAPVYVQANSQTNGLAAIGNRAAVVPAATSSSSGENGGEDDEDDDPTVVKPNKSKNNILPFWGNEKSMNLNPLILTNILQSPYFKVTLYALKTYHEVIDEIYYQVKHLEPWEQGSRRIGGQTGMCGSVRGVGAGGIVSTPFCILYKLYTLRLTRKQVNGLIKHKDSPYIRAIGLMYIRYTQPPDHLWDWLSLYLEDEEQLDVKAGGGQVMSIGQIARHMITKLDWFSTLFPRIPVPVQKTLETHLRQYDEEMKAVNGYEEGQLEDDESNLPNGSSGGQDCYNESSTLSNNNVDGRSDKRSRGRASPSSGSMTRRSGSRDRDRHRYNDRSNGKRKSRSRSRERSSHSRDRRDDRDHRHRHRHRH